MGVEANRIETEIILKTLMNKNIEVEIHIKQQNIKGKITDFNLDKNIIATTIVPPEKYLLEGDRVSIYFAYFSHIMSFTALVLKISDNIVIFSYPKNIYKNLNRKFERIIAPKGSKVIFSIKGEKFQLDFPKTNEYSAVNFSELKHDGFFIDDITRLIDDFKVKILESVNFVEIVLYRNKKPKTIEEKLIYSSGKILYISSTLTSRLGTEIINDIPMINDNIIENYIDGGRKKLKASCFEKINTGIYSEIYCPILYHEYVMGYIQLQNKKVEPIGRSILEYVYQFSQILSYVFKKKGYFGRNEEVDENYECTIIDISGSGLLFSSDSKKLEKYFFLNIDIKMKLYIGMKKVSTRCRLVRKFKSSTTFFFGLIFLNIPEEYFESFFSLVYGRAITEDDIAKWEGGAPPPKIELN